MSYTKGELQRWLSEQPSLEKYMDSGEQYEVYKQRGI